MKFILKKIGTLIITLVIISFLSFLAFSLIPGDAAVANLGMDADEAAVEALREELGLNRPVVVQYGDWLFSALQGDFGESTQYHLPVSELVAKRLPATITLAIYSMIIITLVSFPLGMLGTKKPADPYNRHILSKGYENTLPAGRPFRLPGNRKEETNGVE